MTRDLFLAILSMDSYNRGYNARINGLGETGLIGDAVISAATAEQKEGWEAANFYAIAYNWNGETIISYRGTDDYNIFDPSSDIWQGWSLGAGMPSASQGAYALAFYASVVTKEATQSDGDEAVLTGHSLGAGLAGFVPDIAGIQVLSFCCRTSSQQAQNDNSKRLAA